MGHFLAVFRNKYILGFCLLLLFSTTSFAQAGALRALGNFIIFSVILGIVILGLVGNIIAFKKEKGYKISFFLHAIGFYAVFMVSSEGAGFQVTPLVIVLISLGITFGAMRCINLAGHF
ncbi:MAG: hypothetical protein GY810_10885 [Aureispira sp.]|nr:hypothetical protein [Aureispira sp.]